MSDFLITPLMNLPNPVPTEDPGPDYATNLQSCLNIIDGHNHTVGSGNQINVDGILINADLPFNSFNATQLRSTRYSAQTTPLALATDLNCSYFSGVDFYVNDGNGNQVRITSGGNVNATSSGISSPPASAAFAGSVLVVNQNTNTPGNIQAGSVLIGNNSVGSNFVTLTAPSSLGSNYPLVFPAGLPGAQSFMSLDASGNIASYAPVAQGIITTNIADGAVTVSKLATDSVSTIKIIDNAVTPAKLSAPNYSAKPFSTSNTSSTTAVAITGASTSITASGLRPVQVTFSGSAGTVNVTEGNGRPYGIIRVDVGGTSFYTDYAASFGSAGTTSMTARGPWPSPITVFPSAGSLTVTMYFYVVNALGASCSMQVIGGTMTVLEL